MSVAPEVVRERLAAMTGEVDQVPSAVSAIKVNGVRAYKMVRQGETVELAARRVTISRIEVFDIRPVDDFLDVDVEVACSSGTYIRAIARDLGAALEVGGHLTALRRTAVGGFTLEEAASLEALAELADSGGDPVRLPLAQAIERAMPVRTVDAETRRCSPTGDRWPRSEIPAPTAFSARTARRWRSCARATAGPGPRSCSPRRSRPHDVASIAYSAAMTDPPVWHDESAARHWRSLVAAIAPGVAIALLLQGLLTASAGVAVLDGSYVTKPGWQQYAALPVWIVAWTVSVSAAMLIVRGSLIAAPVRAGFALRATVRRLGWALGVLVALVLFIALLLLVAVPIASVLGPFGIVAMFIAVFIPASTILALPFVALDGEQTAPAFARAWELSAGKRWRAFGLFLLVSVPAAAVQWLADLLARWRPGAVWSVLLNVVLAGAIVILISFQATVLTRWRLRQDTTAEHRYPGSAPRPDRWRLGTALILGAVLAVGAVTWARSVRRTGAQLGEHGIGLRRRDGADRRRPLGTGQDEHRPAGLGRPRGDPAGRADAVRQSQQQRPERGFRDLRQGELCDTKLLTTLEKPGLAWLGSAAVVFGDALVIVAMTQHTGMPADRAELVLWRCRPSPATRPGGR